MFSLRADLGAVREANDDARRVGRVLAAAAQVEIESKIDAKLKAIHPQVSFKRLVPGAFNVGFIGSTCTALPGGG